MYAAINLTLIPTLLALGHPVPWEKGSNFILLDNRYWAIMPRVHYTAGHGFNTKK